MKWLLITMLALGACGQLSNYIRNKTMLTKHTEIDKIEIVGPHRHMQIREATIIMDTRFDIVDALWTTLPCVVDIRIPIGINRRR